jgi:signal transduction histidine kinase/DNA-binding NarL/FixJ family response regulator
MKRQSVLIADADRSRLLAEALESAAREVTIAAEGQDPARLALESRADALILVIGDPQQAGVKAIRALRGQGFDAPIVCTAPSGSEESVLEAYRLGANLCLVAPFDRGQVRAALDLVLPLAASGPDLNSQLQQLCRENDRLRRRLGEAAALVGLSRAAILLGPPDEAVDRLLKLAAGALGAEESLIVLKDESGAPTLRAVRGPQRHKAPLGKPIAHRAVLTALRAGRPVLKSGKRLKAPTGHSVRSLLYSPIVLPGGECVGVIGVTTTEPGRRFTDRDADLLSALAIHAGVALVNAQLFDAVDSEREKLEAILRGDWGGVVLVDEQKRVSFCNDAACAALGLVAERALGLPLEQAIPQTHLRDIASLFDQKAETAQREISLEDGRTVDAQIAQIDGVGWALVVQDISHLKELERIRSEFVSSVSHDLRTPLATILGYVDLLLSSGELSERGREFAGFIRESAESVTRFIDDLLEIGRIEAGRDLEMCSCDLLAVIERAVHSCQPLALEKGQELRWDPPQELPPISGSPHRLRQVMDNLLVNAVKYTGVGGWVSVTAHAEGDHVVVRVADNGIGIPVSQQPYIFDRFYRVDTEETAGIEGTGLGLSIVKSVVEKHSGRVWVESSPGKGSAFTIVIPTLPA